MSKKNKHQVYKEQILEILREHKSLTNRQIAVFTDRPDAGTFNTLKLMIDRKEVKVTGEPHRRKYSLGDNA